MTTVVAVKDAECRYPRQLAGDMPQRGTIACALAQGAEILPMDEPFASVDAQTHFDLEDLRLALRHRLDLSVVVVTHDIDGAAYLADRVTVRAGTGGRGDRDELAAPREEISIKVDQRFAEYRSRNPRCVRRPELSAAARGSDT